MTALGPSSARSVGVVSWTMQRMMGRRNEKAIYRQGERGEGKITMVPNYSPGVKFYGGIN